MNYEHWLYDDIILRTELLALAVIGLLVFLDKRKKAKANKVRAIAAADALDMAHKATWQDIE